MALILLFIFICGDIPVGIGCNSGSRSMNVLTCFIEEFSVWFVCTSSYLNRVTVTWLPAYERVCDFDPKCVHMKILFRCII